MDKLEMSTLDILKNLNFNLYEFEDIAEEQEVYKNPLFCDSAFFKENNIILYPILSKVPLYHCSATITDVSDNDSISIYRDNSIKFVPSYLQEDFWKTWFNTTWGEIQNSILLNIFNTLKYPMINENIYLGAEVFSKLIDNDLSGVDLDSGNTRIEFMDNLEDYSSTYYKRYSNSYLSYTDNENNIAGHSYEMNYVEYINEIVNEKLLNIYSLLNYTPTYFKFLQLWSDSLINSASLDTLDVSKEISVYRLQDIKFEMLRRKFAGSSTLYTLMLSSIGRQGGINRTIELGKIVTSTEDKGVFKDKRRLKLINYPGIILSDEDKDYKPYSIMSEEAGNDYGLPYDLLNSLYYTSAPMDTDSNDDELKDFLPSDEYYSADRFNKSDKYRLKHLRDNSNVIDLNSLSCISDSISSNYYYFCLDEYDLVEDTSSDYGYTRRNRQLDSFVTYIDDDKNTVTERIRLDIQLSNFSSQNVSGIMFDITANQMLYYQNSLQEQAVDSYPYLTYSIADNCSVFLMDTYITDYIISSIEEKSRVQDKVDVGTQVSFFKELIPCDGVEVEDNFFVLGFQDYTDVDKREFGDITYNYNGNQFAVLQYVSIFYDSSTFKIQEFNVKTITRITLRTTSSINDSINQNDIYESLKQGPIGVIPITYTDFVDTTYFDEISKKVNSTSVVESTVIDVTSNVINDANNNNYTLGNFLFGDSKSLNSSNFGNISPNDLLKSSKKSDIEILNTIPFQTGNNLYEYGKLYFCINRKSVELNSTTGLYETINSYSWSSPIYYVSGSFADSLINYTDFSDLNEYYPDWKNLRIQFNPYLNITKKSSTPLRYLEKNVNNLIIDNSTNDWNRWRRISTTEENNPSESKAINILESYNGSDFICYRDGINIDTESNGKNVETYPFIYGTVLNDGTTSGEVSFNFKLPDDSSIINYEKVDNAYDKQVLTISSKSDFIYSSTALMVYIHKDDDTNLIDSIEKANISKIEYATMSSTYFNNDNLTFYMSSGSHLVLITGGFKSYCDNNGLSIEKDSDVKLLESYGYFDVSFDKLDNSVIETIIKEGKEEPLTYFLVNDKYLISDLKRHFSISSSSVVSDKYYYIYSDSTLYLSKEINEDKVTIDFSQNNNIYTDNYGINYIYVNRLSLLNETFISKINEYKSSIGYKDGTGTCKALITYRNVALPSSDYYELTEKLVDLPDSVFVSGSANQVSNSMIKFWTSLDMFTNELYIYDFRVFISKDSMEFTTPYYNGTFRQQYSYSSSIFRLAYSIYRDNGIFKYVTSKKGLNSTNSDSVQNSIDSIRVFNRDVWDSILLDRYPDDTYEEGYIKSDDGASVIKYDKDIYKIDNIDSVDYLELNDCILQALKDKMEVNNNIVLSNDITIRYGQQNVKISNSSGVTLSNTTIYPIHYKNEAFASGDGGQLPVVGAWNNDNINFDIKLPVYAIKNTLQYFADINPNFIQDTESDFSLYYNKGDNVNLTYDDTNKVGVMTLSSRTRDVEKSYIQIPLKLVKLSQKDVYFIYKFLLRNFKISSEFSKMLDAQAYYNELVIPIASRTISSDGKYEDSYIYKYDGIRLYKEGTYYITVKYPMMIQPMQDNDYSKTTNPVIYGSMRFKIEVTGNESINSVDDVKVGNTYYSSSNIVDKLNSITSLYTPSDNRTFKYRTIDIRLYAMNNSESYNSETSALIRDNYSWELIGSNIESECSEDIVYLNTEAISNGLFIKKQVCMYLSRNYNMPFFVAKEDSDHNYDSRVPSDDLIYPIQVLYTSTANQTSEILSISNIDELLDSESSIKLWSYKDYTIIFDYTSNVTEISYTNKESFLRDETITEDELKNYARLTHVYDGSNINEYLYTELYSGEQGSKLKYSLYKDDSVDFCIWKISVPYYGNPYAKDSSKNIAITSSNRDTVNNSYFIPYGINTSEYSKAYGTASIYDTYIDSYIPAYRINNSTLYKNNSIKVFNEINAVKTIYSSLYSKYSINRNVSFISELSKIQPYLCRGNYIENETVDYKKNIISNAIYDLYYYINESRTVFHTYSNNNFLIESQGLYNNNLITSSYYIDSSWSGTMSNGTWVNPGDDEGDNDLYQVNITGDNNTIIYSKGNNAYKGKYEVAINVIGDCTIKAQFISNGTLVGTAESMETSSTEALKNYSVELDSGDEYVDGIVYIFSGNSTIKIGKAIVRLYEVKSHQMGFSNVLNTTEFISSNTFTIPSFYYLFYRSKLSNLYITVQRTNRINDSSKLIIPRFITEGLYDMDIESDSNEKKARRLLEPWTRQICFYENELSDDEGENYTSETSDYNLYEKGYVVEVDNFGKKSLVATSACKQLYTNSDGISAQFSTDREYLELSIPVSNGLSSMLNEFTFKLNDSESKDKFGTSTKNIPLSLENEKFSAFTDCFSPEKLLQGDDSIVSVTNIQYLYEQETSSGTINDCVIYELEYLPIIYNEKNNHISINLVLSNPAM